MVWISISDYIDNHCETDKNRCIFISGDGAAWIKSGAEYIEKALFYVDKFHLIYKRSIRTDVTVFLYTGLAVVASNCRLNVGNIRLLVQTRISQALKGVDLEDKIVFLSKESDPCGLHEAFHYIVDSRSSCIENTEIKDRCFILRGSELQDSSSEFKKISSAQDMLNSVNPAIRDRSRFLRSQVCFY